MSLFPWVLLVWEVTFPWPYWCGIACLWIMQVQFEYPDYHLMLVLFILNVLEEHLLT